MKLYRNKFHGEEEKTTCKIEKMYKKNNMDTLGQTMNEEELKNEENEDNGKGWRQICL